MIKVAVTDPSCAFEARRAVTGMAASLGFDTRRIDELALIATEVATNLLKHAGGGEIFASPFWIDDRVRGLELLAIDRGPGISRMADCLTDGYSTSGTSGGGLGAIRRLSESFDIHSRPGSGTTLVLRVHPASHARAGAPAVEMAGITVAKSGETACGDAWATRHLSDGALILLCDGLGHGPLAAAAAELAVDLFEHTPLDSPAAIVGLIHAGLKATRGAAVAVARLVPAAGQVVYAGLGNISGVLLSGGTRRHMVSHNGIAGHQASRNAEFSYPWEPGALLVLNSDGLTNRWDLDLYPGLVRHHPGLIAATLYRDFSRGSDDTSVVVARERAA